jgi:hypothetical protein
MLGIDPRFAYDFNTFIRLYNILYYDYVVADLCDCLVVFFAFWISGAQIFFFFFPGEDRLTEPHLSGAFSLRFWTVIQSKHV